MKHYPFLFLSLLLGLPANAAGDLDRVVVTATRLPIPADESIAPVIVIDREQIERSLATDVAELLRFHAGLELGRNGGPGQATSLFIRGTDSNHALVLIDGVELNPGTIGGAALQNISPRMIERIEVVKGPRSSLYGSEAIGGVVNIITRQDTGLSLRAGAGRYGSRELALSTGLVGERGTVSASVSRLETDGFPTRDADSAPDRGFDNTSLGLNAATTLIKTELSLRHWQSEGNTEYLDFFLSPVDQDYTNRATAVAVAAQPASAWTTALTVSEIADHIQQQQSPDFADTDRLSIDWQNDFSLGDDHSLVAGVYVSREKTRALSFGTAFDERTDADALYLEDYLDFESGQLLLAARYTDHDTFGDQTTWNAEYAHRLASGWRLSAAAGTGFRAPDATDRFGFGGNPGLASEESQNLELAVDRRFANGQRLRISVFRNDIDNLIEYVFDPVTFEGSNLNVAEARITGVDAAWDWQTGAWQFDVGALLQDPEDRQNGEPLSRRARRSITVNVVRDFEPFKLGLNLLATSKRKDSPFSDTMNAGYALLNLDAGWQASPAWRLQARLENLLDRDYQTAAGFNSAGRGLYVSAVYRRQ